MRRAEALWRTLRNVLVGSTSVLCSVGGSCGFHDRSSSTDTRRAVAMDRSVSFSRCGGVRWLELSCACGVCAVPLSCLPPPLDGVVLCVRAFLFSCFWHNMHSIHSLLVSLFFFWGGRGVYRNSILVREAGVETEERVKETLS